MKKAIITIAVVALFTLVFLFSFRFLSDAAEIELDGNMPALGETTNEATDEIISDKIQETLDENVSSDTEESLRAEEIKEYIKERIIPVIVGVLTSLSAVLASLGAIKKSLVRLSGARDDFKNEANERKSEFERQSELLNRKAEELSRLARLIPQLESELCELKAAQEKLNAEAYNIGKMISLGFSGSQSVIKSGNGRKISALLSECRTLSGKRDLEIESDGENGETGMELQTSEEETQNVSTRAKKRDKGEKNG